MGLTQKLEQSAAPVLAPRERIVVAVRVAKPGYLPVACGGAVAGTVLAQYLGLGRLGPVGAVLLVAPLPLAIAFTLMWILTALDRPRVARLRSQGIPMATVMVWAVTPTRLLMWSASPVLGSVGELLAVHPLAAIEELEPPDGPSVAPKVGLRVGGYRYRVEVLHARKLRALVRALGRG